MVDPTSSEPVPGLRGLSPPAAAVLAGFVSTSEVPAGGFVVREGDRSRDVFVVVEGDVQLLRGGVELARLGPGDVIGSVAFVTGLPSPTTAVAVSGVRLAHLPFERFRLLSAAHPEAADELHELLVSRLARAGAGGGGAPSLGHERSLPRRADVPVRIQGVTRLVPVGTQVRRLLPDRLKGRLVVAAVMDHKAVSLTTPVTAACEVAPVSTDHWEGQRVYRSTLGLAVLEALRRVAPDVQARTGPSLGFAQRFLVRGIPAAELSGLASRVEASLRELVLEAAPLREEWWSVGEALEHFSSEHSDAAPLLETWRDPAVPLVSYGRVYAIELGPLLPDTGLLEGFHLLADADALLLVYGAESSTRPLASTLFPAPPESWSGAPRAVAASQAPDAEPESQYLARHARRASAYASAVTVQQERWLAALEVTSVGAFNRACVSGDVSQIVRVSEGFHEKRIGAIADEIRDRLPDVRVVCIAGPSSSGKSTFIRRLEVQLQVNGIRPVGLSLDDYYVDRHLTPRDRSGGYDYEAFEALRVDLLGEQVAHLLEGATVTTSRYDFTTGASHPEGGRALTLGERDVLLLEGIHGLNPHLLHRLPAERILRIFCAPVAQLPFDSLTRVHASDVRLIRRVVRDRHTRSTDAAGTIARWPSVRAGERTHIFPFQHHADAVFDSSLVYEMGVLRVFAERYLLEVPREHSSYATAFRLIRLLDRFVSIYPDHVPRTSILREFVGGQGL